MCGSLYVLQTTNSPPGGCVGVRVCGCAGVRVCGCMSTWVWVWGGGGAYSSVVVVVPHVVWNFLHDVWHRRRRWLHAFGCVIVGTGLAPV